MQCEIHYIANHVTAVASVGQIRCLQNLTSFRKIYILGKQTEMFLLKHVFFKYLIVPEDLRASHLVQKLQTTTDVASTRSTKLS